MPARDERGAVAVLVTICLVVVFAMAALVIDLGALYTEKRELQNGADAAALAVARACAEGACGATSLKAQQLADSNALDGHAAVDSAIVDRTSKTVTVITSTEEDGGGTEVPLQFAPAVGLEGKTVRATAVARWGPPSRGDPVPLTMSICDWDAATKGGTSFTSGPPWPATPVTLLFHNGTGLEQPGQCAKGPAGQSVPGGFGWLDSTGNGICSVAIDVGSWAEEDPGASPSRDCDTDDLWHKTILVPVYDRTAGQGTGATFHIRGFGAFYVAGFSFPGAGWRLSTCPVSSTCILGWFTRWVVPGSAADPSGVDLGVLTVSLTG